MKKVVNRKIYPISFVFSIIVLFPLFLKFTSFRWDNIQYALSGFDLLFGKTLASGQLIIKPNIWIILIVTFSIAKIILSFICPVIKRRYFYFLNLVFLFSQFIASLLFSLRIVRSLLGAKGVSTAHGITILIGLLVIEAALVLFDMYRNEYVNGLTFLLIPGALYLFINNYIPMAGILLAFKRVDFRLGLVESPWVGMKNFENLFYSSQGFFQSDAFIITRNTILYNLAFIILGLTIGATVGIMLSEIYNIRVRKFYQTTILIPQLISMIVVSYIVFAFLSSSTGLITKRFFPDENINFYGRKWIWPFILTFINIWKNLGYNGILFLASVAAIDQALYEAARIDGASRIQRVFYITIPLLRPTFVTLLIILLGRIMSSDFGLFYQVPLDSGALYSVTNTIDTYVYRSLMVSNNIATSSAAGAYQAIVGFIIVLAANAVIRKLDRDSAVF